MTAVDNSHKRALLEELGADVVLDHTRQQATRTGRTYDLILDLAAYRSVLGYRHSLAPGGRYRVVGGAMSALLQAATVGRLYSLMSDSDIGVLVVRTSAEALQTAVDLVTAGVMKPVIDTVYPLDEVREAPRHHGECRARGKVVISVGNG